MFDVVEGEFVMSDVRLMLFMLFCVYFIEDGEWFYFGFIGVLIWVGVKNVKGLNVVDFWVSFLIVGVFVYIRVRFIISFFE